MTQPCAVGIDVGSTTVKLVALDAGGSLVWSHVEPTEPRLEPQLDALLAKAREEAEVGAEVPLVSTGYGRKLVGRARRSATEITCHARGIFLELREPGTLIDVGGQDSKVILIGPDGRVLNFTMNDKCAAGTGRFLEIAAARLRIPIESLGDVALQARDEVAISNTCTVFAESEIVSLIALGHDVEPIVRGLHRSLVQRVAALARSTSASAPLMLSGGVAMSSAFRTFMGEALGFEVLMPRRPQLVGAIGAASMALPRT